jgi:hypothetical protein
MDFDPCLNWYHGSAAEFSVLRMGSTITQNQELARIFSHLPNIVSVSDDGRIKHNGKLRGFLYIVYEEVKPDDVIPHPHSTMRAGEEWITTRELPVRLIVPTVIDPAEQLTDQELAELLQKHGKF